MENCTKFGQLILSKFIKIVATSCQISRLKCTKFDFGPRPRWELTALPDPQAELRGPTSKGREERGEGKGKEGEWREGKGEGRGMEKGKVME